MSQSRHPPGIDSKRVSPLATRAPMHLEATVRVLQRRPTNPVDVWTGDRYLRLLAMERTLAIVAVVNNGTVDQPDLRLSVQCPPSPASPPLESSAKAAAILRRILGLDVDPEPFRQLAASEPGLYPTALALRGMRPPRFTELFETFANVVPFQQLSLDAGVAIVRNLVQRFGQCADHEERRLYASPEASTIAQARLPALRACGLSLRKAQALRDIARAIESGSLDEERIAGLSTGDALQMLRELPGIGPWSAALVLLRGFGRLDVFPPGDVGADRGLSELSGAAPGAALTRLVRRFGDQQGYLYFHALGSNLLRRGLIRAA